MKKSRILLIAFLVIGVFQPWYADAQGVLRKIKDRTEDKFLDAVFDGKKDSGSESSDRVSTSRGANTRGEGLSETAPDVMAHINYAKADFADQNYGQSRFNVRQAILGVELEIGSKILEGLPEEIENIPASAEEDRVTSSGIGFIGLIIERVYRMDDMELFVTIGNDAALLSFVNMYLASGAYASSTDQDYKQVQFKGHRGIIEYDENSGYKLSVPFGQSSILVVEGVNFETEQSLMTAADYIDIEKIKSELGG